MKFAAGLLLIALVFVVTPLALAECDYNYLEGNKRDKTDVSISLKVSDVGETFDRVLAAVRAVKGKVVKQTKNETRRCSDGRIVATIPTAKVRPLSNHLRKLGEVVQEVADLAAEHDDVEMEIRFSDREGNGYGQQSHATFFAGVQGGLLQVSGVAGDLKRPGAGIVIAAERQQAQLTIFVLQDGKDEEAEAGDAATEKKKSKKGSSLALVSHAFYSSVLGDGERTFLNPYAGLSYGYAHLDGVSAFAIAGNLGLELVKVRYVMWSVTGSLLSFYNSKEGSTGRLVSTQISIPF